MMLRLDLEQLHELYTLRRRVAVLQDRVDELASELTVAQRSLEDPMSPVEASDAP